MDAVDDLGELEQHLPATTDRRRVLERQHLNVKGGRGSYQLELVSCGKGKCKCARGALHGPYWYEYRWSVRSRPRKLVSRYVGKEGSPAAVAAGLSPASSAPASRSSSSSRACMVCHLEKPAGSSTVRVDGFEITGHPACIDQHVAKLERMGPLEYRTTARAPGEAANVLRQRLCQLISGATADTGERIKVSLFVDELRSMKPAPSIHAISEAFRELERKGWLDYDRSRKKVCLHADRAKGPA